MQNVARAGVSLPPPFQSCAEKMRQRGGVGLAGHEADVVDVEATEFFDEFSLDFGAVGGEGFAIFFGAEVEFADFAGLGVFEHQTAERGQGVFVRVVDLDGHHIVPALGAVQGGVGEGIEEIRNHNHHRASAEGFLQMLQCVAQIAGAMGGGVMQNIAHHAQHVALAFAGAHVFFHVIGEERESDFVIVALGDEGQRGGHFAGEFLFGLIATAEPSRRADVHQQHHRQLAFLHELFYKWLVQSRGDVPIDIAHLIARLIFAHLIEIHPLPTKYTAVLADHYIAHEPLGADFDATKFCSIEGWHGVEC